MSFRLEPCSVESATLAVTNWHYSRVMPTGKQFRLGVHEDGSFRGVIIFSRGASPFLQSKWGVKVTEICELTRVALRSHTTPVSRLLAVAVRLLRKANPGLRLIVSFADPTQGHHGGIYKAAGWTYTGQSNATVENFIGGRWRHMRGSFYEAGARRAAGSRVPQRTVPGKHRYVLVLDPRLARVVESARRESPKASKPKGGLPTGTKDPRQAVAAGPEGPSRTPAGTQGLNAAEASRDAPGYPPGEGGSTPTPPLQSGGH